MSGFSYFSERWLFGIKPGLNFRFSFDLNSLLSRKYKIDPISGKKRMIKSQANFHLVFLKVEEVRSNSAPIQKIIKMPTVANMKYLSMPATFNTSGYLLKFRLSRK